MLGSAEFVVKPENVSVVLGKSAWVHCQGEGDPEPKVSYLRNNKDELRNNSNYKVWPNGTMQIKKMTKDDVGTFHCWLTQSYHIGATSFSVKIKGINMNLSVVVTTDIALANWQTNF